MSCRPPAVQRVASVQNASLKVGDSVELFGLSSSRGLVLNGQHARIVCTEDPVSRRWGLEQADGSRESIKFENRRILGSDLPRALDLLDVRMTSELVPSPGTEQRGSCVRLWNRCNFHVMYCCYTKKLEEIKNLGEDIYTSNLLLEPKGNVRLTWLHHHGSDPWLETGNAHQRPCHLSLMVHPIKRLHRGVRLERGSYRSAYKRYSTFDCRAEM